DQRRRDRRRTGLAAPAVGGPQRADRQSVGVGGRNRDGLVGGGAGVLAAATVVVTGSRRRHRRHRGRGRQRDGFGRRGVMATALLQVAAGSDRKRRRSRELAPPRAAISPGKNRRS